MNNSTPGRTFSVSTFTLRDVVACTGRRQLRESPFQVSCQGRCCPTTSVPVFACRSDQSCTWNWTKPDPVQILGHCRECATALLYCRKLIQYQLGSLGRA